MGIDPGRRARLYDFQLSSAAPLYVDSNLYEAETPLELEVHAGAEVGVLLAGAEEHHLDDWHQRALPGDVWLTAAWEPHGWRVAAPRTEDVLLIFLPQFLGEEHLGSLSWLDLFAVPPGQRPQVATPEMRQRTLALGYDLRREMREQRPGWETAIRLDLLSLLLVLSREWEPPDHPHPRRRARPGNLPRVMPALSLVQSERGRRISVAEAARACGLGRAHFCRIFQETMGMSFGRFCLRSRLGYVAELLRSSDLPTSGVAEAAGFADGSHVHRAFVKHYGCTPGQYRADSSAGRDDRAGSGLSAPR